ncbi:hypothetical protein CLU95_0906 [Variovorax sp. 54]|nr:hypothetical protein CLU95_0906 [Variovorax sp. 54]
MINGGIGYDFKGKPYFALAGVGLQDGYDWDERIKELRDRYRVPSGELKFESLVSKPKFSAAVINALLDQQAPLFVEVVDKRYFICTCIASFQLLPPCLGYPESMRLEFLKNAVADFLNAHASGRVLDSFVASCLMPGGATLRASFSSLRDLATKTTYEGAAAQVAKGFGLMVEVVEAEYRELSVAQHHPWLNFLPPPELNRHSKQGWMLLNLTSFTSIYARMNRYYRRRLAGIRLVHDQQFEVGSILRQDKAAAERMRSKMDLPYTSRFDDRVEQVDALDPGQSHEVVGVQIADVVAGATMRFFRDSNTSTSMSSELREAMMRLISAEDERTGYGLKQVVPTGKVRTSVPVA